MNARLLSGNYWSRSSQNMPLFFGSKRNCQGPALRLSFRGSETGTQLVFHLAIAGGWGRVFVSLSHPPTLPLADRWRYPGGMDKTRVYVETTIPSFYHEARTTPDIVARRDWTRRWWIDAVERHELVTSEAVLDELGDDPPEHNSAWLALVRDLPLLTIDSAVAEIVETYVRHRLMPAAPDRKSVV